MHAASTGPNPIPADHVSAEERLNEIAGIIAAGLRRINVNQSSSLSSPAEDSSFDILALKRRVGRRKPSNRIGGH
jgi:hypothetical protein